MFTVSKLTSGGDGDEGLAGSNLLDSDVPLPPRQAPANLFRSKGWMAQGGGGGSLPNLAPFSRAESVPVARSSGLDTEGESPDEFRPTIGLG
eukprot:CAMPEP_0174920476 /NCGR_PEP_ID=MMETSP1355-20121228/4436_1 /TAXON_ID=464990 /ORGANISM="Hemiselmis tepida, Strain CCMP443" /LENGTH=91 /DNA_ID=CAMNT_0016165825 /DNA_START=76 /DNA_END=351 /DNA_ORIENTATION=-